MYTLEIVEAVAYIMGAKDQPYKKNFGVSYPLLLESDKTTMSGHLLGLLRVAFKIRNIILFSQSPFDAISYPYDERALKKEELHIFFPPGLEITRESELTLLNKVNIYIKDTFSEIKGVAILKEHYNVFYKFAIMEVVDKDEFLALREQVKNSNIKYPLGIYLPDFKCSKGDKTINFIFKNDYLLLKHMYGLLDKKINFYRDYYCKSTREPLRSLDTIIYKANRCELFIDCDNINSTYAYLLIDHLKKLPQMTRINLVYCNDSAFRWEILKGRNLVHYPVERISKLKNSSDIVIGSKMSEAFYTRKCRNMVLLSSDSDFFGVINSMPEVKFTLLTSGKTSNQYISRMCALEIPNFEMEKLFDLRDVLYRASANTSYYTDTVTAAIHENSLIKGD